LNSGSHGKQKVGANHAVKGVVRFWDSLASADKKHRFVLKNLFKPFVIHIFRQQMPVGQQITAWKIIAAVII
jgi:hypothetical protein